MSPHASLLSPTALITQLRQAGCVFAEEEAELITATARTPHELVRMADARSTGLPLEHVLGWTRFHGVRLVVEPGVFVPRPRTEFLAEQALALTRPQALVVDLCCGTAALGAVLATHRQGVRVHAADIDAASVRCARRNLTPLGGQVHHGDLFDPLPPALLGRVDVLVVNAPYVPTREIGLLPAEMREHESQRSLDGGPDGLDVVRRVAARARVWLAPRGHLLVQAHPDQVAQACDAFTRGGLVATSVTCQDTDTSVVVGRRPPA
ncbi:putative protein N(5)-glutamine methyltransferase [Nocardiopsis ganjiahuensis]|uniref:putative protein N(5)-glutamine methyltransferase n=1 Tax=Nocardiopsis ganjiahuensis TaxID=239984 RepID=UPI00034C60CC|nr:putative protein N(5)-glutamine methyltransferase [Nocardiopsis ganjiahuensis]